MHVFGIVLQVLGAFFILNLIWLGVFIVASAIDDRRNERDA